MFALVQQTGSEKNLNREQVAPDHGICGVLPVCHFHLGPGWRVAKVSKAYAIDRMRVGIVGIPIPITPNVRSESPGE